MKSRYDHRKRTYVNSENSLHRLYKSQIPDQARHVAGLFQHDIKTYAKDVQAALYGPQHLMLFDDDPAIQAECLAGAAHKIYQEQLQDQHPKFSAEAFSYAILEMFEQEIEDDDKIVVADGDGDTYLVNKHFARAVQTRGNLAEQRHRMKRVANEIQKKHKNKLRKLTNEKERSLVDKPKNYRHRRAAGSQIKRFLNWMDEYKATNMSKHEMNEHDWNHTYRMRAMGAYIVKERVKFDSRIDYCEFARNLQVHWGIERSSYHYAKQSVLHAKNLLYKSAFPMKYIRVSPNELLEMVDKLNAKYHSIDKRGTPFCLRAWYVVRRIMREGQTFTGMYEEVIVRKLKKKEMEWNKFAHQQPDKIEQVTQLSLHDQYIHFPPPPLPRQPEKVGYVDAVKQVISYHPNRMEQDILWQIFARYNHFFRTKKKFKDPKAVEVAMKEYDRRKQREHDELHGVAQDQLPEHDFYTEKLYLPPNLVDMHAVRIKD